MYPIWLLILIHVLYVYGCSEEQEKVINQNVKRKIDLRSQLVKVFAVITLKNIGNEAISEYVLALDPELSGILPYISVKDDLMHEMKVTPTAAVSKKDTIFTVQLKQTLESNVSTNIYLEYILANTLVPYPKSIKQHEKQFIKFSGNHYFYSPYTTIQQTTSILLPSDRLENYTKRKPVLQSTSNLNYGPYYNISSFSIDVMIVHYENHSPFLTVTHLERHIEISHWGNIAVKNNIEIHHTGAKLKGPFSRYDYLTKVNMNNHHSVHTYVTILPQFAHDIHYTDINGNISSSAVMPKNDKVELHLSPRFPLFGGWKTLYRLDYSLPIYLYLFQKLTRYELFFPPLDYIFDDMYIETLDMTIVLPFGATNFELKTPYEVERLQDAIEYRYLDYFGHPVLRLRKDKLVEHHIKKFHLIYNWDPLMLFYEPLLLAFALFILFVAFIVFLRFEFSIKDVNFPRNKKNSHRRYPHFKNA